MLGQLSGNRFTITLRCCFNPQLVKHLVSFSVNLLKGVSLCSRVAANDDDIIKEAAISLGKSGFINYFGLQVCEFVDCVWNAAWK